MTKTKQAGSSRRRRGRIIAIGVGVPVGILVVLVALGPMLAGPLLRGTIASAVSGGMDGSVELDRLSLRWWGPQRIGPARLLDPEGQVVANLEVETGQGLLSLARRGTSKEATVRASGTIVLEEDGQLNVMRAIGPLPEPDPDAPPPKLPGWLAADVRLELDEVTFEDRTRPGRPSVTMLGRHGRLRVEPSGASTSGSAELELVSARRVDGASSLAEDGGRVRLELQASGAHGADGDVDLLGMRVSVRVDASDLPVDLVDAWTGQPVAEAAGERVGAMLRASLDPAGETGELELDITGEQFELSDVRFALADGQVRNTARATLRVDPSKAARLIEALREELDAEADVRGLENVPVVTVSVEDFALPIGSLESPVPDFHGLRAGVTVLMEEVRGRVAVTPGEPVRPGRLDAVRLSLDVSGEDDRLTLRGGSSAWLGDEPAGMFELDAEVSGLLDGEGGLRAGLPAALEGNLTLSELRTALAAPLLEPFGVDLVGGLGPSMEMTLTARNVEGEGEAAGGAPPIEVNWRMLSDGASGKATLTLDDMRLRTSGEGVLVRASRLKPLVGGVLAGAGVDLDEDDGGEVALSGLSVDLGKLADGPEALARGLGADLTVRLGGLRARSEMLGESPVQLGATTLRVVTEDAAGSAMVRLEGGGRLDGESLGEIDVDLRVEHDVLGRVLAADVGPGLIEAVRIEGRAALRGASTGAVERLLAVAAPELALDLSRDVGPSVDTSLRFEPGDRGQLVVLSLESSHLTGTGVLRARADRIELTEQGFVMQASRAGALAAGVAPESGLADSGGASVAVSRLSFDPGDLLGTLEVDGRIELTELAWDPSRAGLAPAGSQPVRVGSLTLEGGRSGADGGAVAANLRGTFAYANQPFTAQGELSMSDPVPALGTTGIDLTRMVRSGRFEVMDLPVSLAGIVPVDVETPEGRPFDLTGAAEATVGDVLAMILTIDGQETPGELIASATVAGQEVSVQGRGRLTEAELALDQLDLNGSLSPEAAARWMSLGGALPVSAARRVEYEASVAPTRVPLAWLRTLDPAGAPVLTATMKADGRLALDRVALDMGREGVPEVLDLLGLRIEAEAPLSLLLAPEEVATARFRVEAAAAEPEQDPLGRLELAGRVALGGEMAWSGLQAEGSLDGVPVAWMDIIAGTDGLLFDVAGQSLTLSFGADLRPSELGPEGTVRVGVRSPRLRTDGDAVLTVAGDRLGLAEPFGVDWTLRPGVANRRLLGESGDFEPGIRFTDPSSLRLEVERLTLARPDLEAETGPFMPGVFDLRAAVRAERLLLRQPDGVVLTYRDLLASVASASDGQLRLEARMEHEPRPGEVVEPGTVRPRAVDVNGRVLSMFTERGTMSPDEASVTLTGRLRAFPTSIIDAFARVDGLLVETLGPTLRATLETDQLSMKSGRLKADMRSPRAHVRVSGFVSEGVFYSDEPLEAVLNEVTPALTSRILRGAPLIGSIEKRATDEPATVRAENLAMGLDGDMRKLSGAVRVDPGTARFEASAAFSPLLKVTGQREDATFGRRVDPLSIRIEEGKLSYDRFRLPLGEFTVETRGSIDLADRTVDIITYLPFGALSDEAASRVRLNTGRLLSAAGGVLGSIERLTRVPIRTSGPLTNPKTEFDAELFVKETFTETLRPDRILQEGVRDLRRLIR